MRGVLDMRRVPMTPRDMHECPARCGRQALATQLHEVHTVPGTIMPCASIVIYRRRYLPDDVHDGDINAPFEEPEVHKLQTFEAGTFPEQAVTLLASEGIGEYSASGYQENAHAWYSGDVDTDPLTGEREERSAHLYGFTEEERYAVWVLVIGK